MNYSVYKHTSPSGKVYIGITGGDVNIRWMRGYGKQTIFGKAIRKYKTKNYCIGHLYVNGIYECDTLEDVDRGLTSQMLLDEIKAKKIYGNTAIPTGTYIVNMNTVSPKFKDRSWAKPYNGILPRLENVKGYEGVLIHVGNDQEATSGCILVGENKIKGKVINSTACFHELMNELLKAYSRGEDITIEIQ